MIAIEFQGGFERAWERIITFVPKLVGFLVILIIGYFIAKLLAKIVDRVLERVGFDRAVERGGFAQAMARTRYEPSDILGKIVFWTVFLFVLQLAFRVFGPNPISDLIHGLIAFLPNIFVAIVILVIAGALAKVVTEILQSVLAGVSGGEWIARGAGIAILAVGFFAALDQLNIAPTIVTGLFYALLALIVGSGIVAIGGGGIRTMQRYWERSAARLESKGTEVKQQVQRQDTGQLVRDRAEQMRQQARQARGGEEPHATRTSW